MSAGGNRNNSGRKKTTGKTVKTLGCTVDGICYEQVSALASAKNQTIGQWMREAIKRHARSQLDGVM